MITIDGQQLAEDKLKTVKVAVRAMVRPPSLAVVLVGDDAASHLYVGLKEKAAKKAGIEFHKYLLAVDASQAEVLQCIDFLREDADIDGIIVQLPLPVQIDTDVCIAAISAAKDVDGFHQDNIAQFIQYADDTTNNMGVFPVFPLALVSLALAAVGEDVTVLRGEKASVLTGKRAAIITQSDIFAQVMSAACARVGLVPTVVFCDKLACHQAAVLSADVIFTACGKPEILTGKYIKLGAIVIDGGIAKVDGVTMGDIAHKSVAEKAAACSPVPGGVGPMTVACLLENVTRIAQRS